MKIYISLLLCSITLHSALCAQDNDDPVYRVNKLGSMGAVLVGQAVNIVGIQRVVGKGNISKETLASLNGDDVFGFDQSALKLKADNWRDFHNISDAYLFGSLLVPAALLFDRKIRRQASDVSLVFFKTIIFTNMTYSWGPPQFIDRFRPITYYNDADESDRKKSTNRSSFFSGHTTAATSSFFVMAKVYNDFHPDLTYEKWFLYGGATVLSGYMGYLRYRALKHFPSDVAVGMLVGAAGGILIPHWHKKRQERLKLGFGFDGEVKTFRLAHTF